MFPVESLNKFRDSLEFIDLTKESDKEKVRVESDKLRYLQTYPTVVKSKIRSKKLEIKTLENELALDIHSHKSELKRIIRRQELNHRYLKLKEMEEQLRKLKEELIYAENVKAVAQVRLQIYEELLSNHKEGDLYDRNNSDNL